MAEHMHRRNYRYLNLLLHFVPACARVLKSDDINYFLGPTDPPDSEMDLWIKNQLTRRRLTRVFPLSEEKCFVQKMKPCIQDPIYHDRDRTTAMLLLIKTTPEAQLFLHKFGTSKECARQWETRHHLIRWTSIFSRYVRVFGLERNLLFLHC